MIFQNSIIISVYLIFFNHDLIIDVEINRLEKLKVS